MENSSSRSPDSSCPDYYPYTANSEHANRGQSSNNTDALISSNTVSSSSLGIHFQNNHSRLGCSDDDSTNNGIENSVTVLHPDDRYLGVFTELHDLDFDVAKCKHCLKVFMWNALKEHEERCKMNINPSNCIPNNSGSDSRNGQIPHVLLLKQQNNKRSVINFATVGGVGNDGDRFRSTPENSSREQGFHNSGRSVLNFPAVGNLWQGSSSDANNSLDFSSAGNYQNSSASPGELSTTSTLEQMRVGHNPPSCVKLERPCYASTSAIFSVPNSSVEMTPFPKLEQSYVSSTIPSNSSIRSSSAKYVNDAIENKTVSTVSPILTSTCSLNPQKTEKSAKSMPEEKGLKRKSSVSVHSSQMLAASSNSNFVEGKQNVSINNKKNRVLANSPFLGFDDDDVQIITPVINRDCQSKSKLSAKGQSSASSSSSSLWPTTNCPKLYVISDSNCISLSSVDTANLTECDQNRVLSRQSSCQSAQEVSTIHNPLSTVELEQILDNVWSDTDELVPPALMTPEIITIPGDTEGDDSSSSSVVSIHEDSNSFETSKPSSLTSDKIPNDIPSLVTNDSSQKNDELQQLKAMQEAENVKEDFKKLLEDELICNICTELLIKPVTLGCSHTFCKFCIGEWKEKKRQCPMCRASIATETPCLFLDNFISKAVEQLDPTSVEKRLEIIKSREEQSMLEKRPPVHHLTDPILDRLFNPSYVPSVMNYLNSQYPHLIHSNHPSRPPDRVRLPSNSVRPQRNLFQYQINLLQQNANLLQATPMNPRSSIISQQSLNAILNQQSSSIPQQSSGIPQQSSGIPQQSLSTPQQSLSSPQQSLSTPQQSLSSLQQSLSTPQQSSLSTPQQSSLSTPQQSSLNLPHQSLGLHQQSSLVLPPRLSLAVPQQLSFNVSQQSSLDVPQQSSLDVPQQSPLGMQSSSLHQQSLSMNHPFSSLLTRSSSIPQQPSNLHHPPFNVFFDFNF